MTALKLVEGYMPIQMLGEMGGLALLFIWAFYLLDKKMGIKVNKLAQATGLFLFSIIYFRFRIYPPIPFSVHAIYDTMTLIRICMAVSSTDTACQDLRQPSRGMGDLKNQQRRTLGAALSWCCPSRGAG